MRSNKKKISSLLGVARPDLSVCDDKNWSTDEVDDIIFPYVKARGVLLANVHKLTTDGGERLRLKEALGDQLCDLKAALHKRSVTFHYPAGLKDSIAAQIKLWYENTRYSLGYENERDCASILEHLIGTTSVQSPTIPRQDAVATVIPTTAASVDDAVRLAVLRNDLLLRAEEGLSYESPFHSIWDVREINEEEKRRASRKDTQALSGKPVASALETKTPENNIGVSDIIDPSSLLTGDQDTLLPKVQPRSTGLGANMGGWGLRSWLAKVEKAGHRGSPSPLFLGSNAPLTPPLLPVVQPGWVHDISGYSRGRAVRRCGSVGVYGCTCMQAPSLQVQRVYYHPGVFCTTNIICLICLYEFVATYISHYFRENDKLEIFIARVHVHRPRNCNSPKHAPPRD